MNHLFSLILRVRVRVKLKRYTLKDTPPVVLLVASRSKASASSISLLITCEVPSRLASGKPQLAALGNINASYLTRKRLIVRTHNATTRFVSGICTGTRCSCSCVAPARFRSVLSGARVPARQYLNGLRSHPGHRRHPTPTIARGGKAAVPIAGLDLQLFNLVIIALRLPAGSVC